MKIIAFIITLALITLTWLTTFGREKTLSGTDKAAVLAFSEPATDNLLAGLAANDYATFSHDFDTGMLASIPAINFSHWNEAIENKLGRYLSRQVDQVTRSDEFYVVVYQAKFEYQESVFFEVAFHVVEPHSISHLWIDSEKLQRK